MTVESFRIPHATAVFVDRSAGNRRGVLRATTALPDKSNTTAEANAKLEMTAALQHAVHRLGLDAYEITWPDGPQCAACDVTSFGTPPAFDEN